MMPADNCAVMRLLRPDARCAGHDADHTAAIAPAAASTMMIISGSGIRASCMRRPEPLSYMRMHDDLRRPPAVSVSPRRDPTQPPAEYARARATRPVFPVTLWDGRRAWLLTRYDDVRAVVADPRFSGEFANPGFPAVTAARVIVDKNERAFVGMDNPRHDHYRRMFTKEFSAKRMMALRPKIAAIANRLIDELMTQPQPADLVAHIAVPFPSLVMCDLVGSPYEDHVFIMECAAGAAWADPDARRRPSARRASSPTISCALIERKEKAPGDDFVSRIVDEHVRTGNLSREDFAEIGAMILRAGHDTTTNMIGLGTLLLLEHPEQAAAMRDDPDVVPGAVEELLRYVSPVQFAPRRVALEDVEHRRRRHPQGRGRVRAQSCRQSRPGGVRRSRSPRRASRRLASSRVRLRHPPVPGPDARAHRAAGRAFRCCCSACRICASRPRKARSASRTTCRSTACTTCRWLGEPDDRTFKVHRRRRPVHRRGPVRARRAAKSSTRTTRAS